MSPDPRTFHAQLDPYGDLSGRGHAFTLERTNHQAERRRAVRYVATHAKDAGDARLLLDALGLKAEEGK
jgi:hypothetical protein